MADIDIDGKKVTDSRHLRLMVAQTAPASKAALKVVRDGKEGPLFLLKARSILAFGAFA